MNLNEQVTSLEYAKRLKELGVKQESIFYWHWYKKNRDYERIECDLNNYKMEDFDDGKWKGICYSAYTASELGEIMPKYISTREEDEEKKIFSNFKMYLYQGLIVKSEYISDIWSINYICDTTNELRNFLFDKLLLIPIHDKSLSNAMAKMLIHLIENKFIEVEV